MLLKQVGHSLCQKWDFPSTLPCRGLCCAFCPSVLLCSNITRGLFNREPEKKPSTANCSPVGALNCFNSLKSQKGERSVSEGVQAEKHRAVGFLWL